MNRAEHFAKIKHNAYKDKHIYESVLAIIKDRAEHGHGILNLNDCACLKCLGVEVKKQLVDELKADGFKVIGSVDNFDTIVTVCW